MPLSPWIAGACTAASRTDGFAAPAYTGTSVREKAVSSAEALRVVFLAACVSWSRSKWVTVGPASKRVDAGGLGRRFRNNGCVQ